MLRRSPQSGTAPSRASATWTRSCGPSTTALPVWHLEDSGPLTPGQPTAAGATCALHALETGIGLTRNQASSALVTGSVSKYALHSIGYTHPGQTEFIAERCGITATNAVMMLAGPSLRVVPLTVHIPLSEVPERLTIELIVAKARIVARGLRRDFGIEAPRIALAGLNPHAGESGQLGSEEVRIMAPASRSWPKKASSSMARSPPMACSHPRSRAI
jgi:4-hydroxythreonine-4-phosphate dehydrogenase